MGDYDGDIAAFDQVSEQSRTLSGLVTDGIMKSALAKYRNGDPKTASK
jgi:hypothetical protein